MSERNTIIVCIAFLFGFVGWVLWDVNNAMTYMQNHRCPESTKMIRVDAKFFCAFSPIEIKKD
jgi:hypothetical protein